MEKEEIFAKARRCWESNAAFRKERNRNKRFTYGDQWSDPAQTGPREGNMTEEEQMRKQGNLPLKNNLIRRLTRNVLGVFRDRWQQPVCLARDPAEARQGAVMQKLLRFNADLNRLGELYARTMEEFLISGMAIHKKWYGRKGRTTDCWTDFVQPDRFFVDLAGRDFRGWDVGMIGEIHEMELEELISSFARTPRDADRFARYYGAMEAGRISEFPKCRVIEVWVREHPQRWNCHDPLTGSCWKSEGGIPADVERENRRREPLGLPPITCRWFVDDEWHWYFFSPDGETLASGTSPYAHGGHPYVFKAYPFIDGEIHSFVADIIDQQKLTNRLITMYDWILRASAKGVLLFPEGALPTGISLDDIADEWSRFNGVIRYKPRPGEPMPQQISSKAVDIGITELLNIQLKMMEDISGVNGALQGKLDSNSMSGTLYNQQTKNSLSALADLMQSFDDFIRDATEKDASNIAQFYSPERIREIAGADAALPEGRYFSADLRDFKFTK